MCPSGSKGGEWRGKPLSSTRRSHNHFLFLPFVSLYNLPLPPTLFHSLFQSLFFTFPHLSRFFSIFLSFFIFFSSSRVSLLSRTAVYHFFPLIILPVTVPSPSIHPFMFIQSLKWKWLMGQPLCTRAEQNLLTKKHSHNVHLCTNTCSCSCVYAHF